MIRKAFLFGIFVIFVFLVSGCTLIKGVGGATGGAVVGLAQGTAGGISQGFKDDVGFIKKADNWVKDNLW